MSEFVDNHPLGRDLPEYKDVIRRLKMEDAHFVKVMKEYETLDKEIVRMEQGVELATNTDLEALKIKRVNLKDSLYEMLRQHA